MTQITPAMFEAAIEAWFRVVKGAESNFLNGTPNPPVPPENLHDAMRAAITAAIEASGLLDLMAKADAVLDHADAHCRAFPIATVPKDRWVDVWDRERDSWSAMYIGGQSILHTCYTHWRERRSWPPETPLPAVFTDLGAALERLKSQP
jgi:hypothetical protein